MIFILTLAEYKINSHVVNFYVVISIKRNVIKLNIDLTIK